MAQVAPGIPGPPSPSPDQITGLVRGPVPQSVALPPVACSRLSQDYLYPSICTLTCNVRTWKENSEVRARPALNLKKPLHGANLLNSPILPAARVYGDSPGAL